MSMHGVIITCSWCKGQHHNRAGCSLRKLGIKPNAHSNPNPVVDEDILDDKPVITQETGHPQAVDVQLHDTMLSQMLEEASSRVAPYQPLGPLPDCSYIAANQPVRRPVPPTTATKAIKAALNKRKAAGTKPKDATGKKGKAAGNKIKTVGLQTTSTCLHKATRLAAAHVKSGEAEGRPSTESAAAGGTPDEESLRRELETAIQEEDYARAAALRDELRVLQEDGRSAVLAANTRFCTAFKNGDLVAMHQAWAKGDHVYVVHPSAGRISGYEMVMQSWDMVCDADYEFPLQIDLQDVEVHVRGDVGYVTCLELVRTKGSSSWGKQVATNVFEKVDGKWFMCIHHASHFDE
ncbi:uncharacterized protein C2845_PM11G23480 [Panicum miliaceum]|uniref:UVR domain-containing protein n=1 Tax=Panicum miliaceum TaxID=4540 RepID=A0A3L6RVQ2_PANMI|nr:uncharacterized protein C2845_PM11G23480 [Panicum miliaceum]